MATRRKVEDLMPLFLEAAKFRNSVSPKGKLDNVGAIHSASRVLDILGLLVRYPNLAHHRNIKRLKETECSVGVCASRRRDAQIEHVQPLRALTIAAIKAAKLTKPGAAKRVEAFLRKNYRLVLLTKEERSRLDKHNRTKIDPKRLEKAKIRLCKPAKHTYCRF